MRPSSDSYLDQDLKTLEQQLRLKPEAEQSLKRRIQHATYVKTTPYKKFNRQPLFIVSLFMIITISGFFAFQVAANKEKLFLEVTTTEISEGTTNSPKTSSYLQSSQEEILDMADSTFIVSTEQMKEKHSEALRLPLGESWTYEVKANEDLQAIQFTIQNVHHSRYRIIILSASDFAYESVESDENRVIHLSKLKKNETYSFYVINMSAQKLYADVQITTSNDKK